MEPGHDKVMSLRMYKSMLLCQRKSMLLRQHKSMLLCQRKSMLSSRPLKRQTAAPSHLGRLRGAQRSS